MNTKGVMVVAGGSRGIGAAISILAAKRGFDVCINYKSNRERALEVARIVESQGRKALIHKADIADESEIVAMFSAVDLSLGRITALVNNGGVNGNIGIFQASCRLNVA